ncbi:GH92 family glycosyl hydrolase [Sphingobacterium thalpophilum]|uniref:GH92 family glycosyl hydrolase n=1 Tax=Sphingobacterium thalpophilum TaxID=259 RepID=UPI003DA21833
MIKFFRYILLGLFIWDNVSAQKLPTDYVNPFIGTTNYGTTNPGAQVPHGLMNVSPFNVMGSSINAIDKDARWWSTPYEHSNSYFTGFSHVNLSGVGCPDMGSLLLMPTSGRLEVDYREYGSTYTQEVAHPGYYSNVLKKYGIKTEVTSTTRVGVSKFTFPKGQANILLNLGEGLTNETGASVRYVSDTELEGSKLLGSFCYTNNQAVYPIFFVMRVNKKPSRKGYWKYQRAGQKWENDWNKDAGKYKIFTEYSDQLSGDDLGAFLSFDLQENETVEVQLAVSFVSVENARKNLEAEQAVFDFEKTRYRASSLWDEELSRILVEGGTDDQKTVFYSTALSGVSMAGASKNLKAEVPKDDFDYYLKQTENRWNEELGKIAIRTADKDAKVKFYSALYHSKLAPTIFGDVDGAYFGADRKIHRAEGWTNYSTFSLWDTYRASHPLFTYTDPDRVNDMVKSFIAFYEQNGRLPVWNIYGSETDMMIGNHAIPVIVDAYLKGIGDFDANKALAACVTTANIDHYRGIGLYKKLGYVPYDVQDTYNSDNWSLSRTLEYAFDDHCIAVMADRLGNKAIAATFSARAKYYRNVYNPASSFMQPRHSSGKFVAPFDPEEYSTHICESNAWQYFWSVQHDIPGLMDLVGGKSRFAQKLDSMFTMHPVDSSKLPIFSTGMIGQYAHGNEPSHHALYLFNAVEEPWKTQHYAAQVMETLYLNNPSGLSGNDDCGQMSAWYVFSALGFYPVDPVSGRYEIGTPIFPYSELKLANGKKFTVKANRVNKSNIYIRSVTINGKPLETSYITHEQIMSGANLVFEMSNKPGPVWYKTR